MQLTDGRREGRKEGVKDYQLSVQSSAGYVIGGEGKSNSPLLQTPSTLFSTTVRSHHRPSLGGFMASSTRGRHINIKGH